MNPGFHYLVKARLIKLSDVDNIEFSEFQEEFYDNNPILARERAFQYYQNILDVLLESKSYEKASDRKARDIIASYLIPVANIPSLSNEDKESAFQKYGTGIGVFLVDDLVDDPIWKESFIHGIGMSYYESNPDFIMGALENEVNYYEKSGFETKHYKKTLTYCNRADYEEGINDWDTYTILETPFDWTGYDVPWWDNPGEFIQTISNTEATTTLTYNIEELIKRGETNQVEFKPTLVYNFAKKIGDLHVKAIIAKAICGFLNSNGGFLLIGIKDDGTIQGLDYDFRLAGEKDPYDFFRLEFDHMVKKFLGFNVKLYINGHFVEINDKIIYVVTVSPSNRPVFLYGKDNIKEFYVRGEASTRQLTDIDELINYCIDRW